MQKKILITSLILPLLFYVYLLSYQKIGNSYFFPIYNSLILFSLPFALAKYLEIKNKIKINAGILFFIYPVIYITAFLISKILPIKLENIINIISIAIIFKWNFLLIFILFKSKWGKTKKFLSEHLFLFPSLLIYAIIFFLIRNVDSIVALDYLQHLSVSEKMRIGESLCLIPNQCSELFIQVGYTTIYHTILGFFTNFSNENVLSSIFILDLIYPLLIATLAFNLFRKFSKNLLLNSFFSLITILIFVNGSYETTFFIPQTLAFIIFLISINKKELSNRELFITILFLFLTHFIMGIFLSFFLILKHLLLDKLDPKILREFTKHIFFFAVFTPIILLIINSSGFSIESSFQKSAVESIGGFTNLIFPRNIFAYLTMWGGAIIFFISSIFLQTQKSKPWYLYSLIFISITLSLYLLAPTYANKFLLGTSIFGSILMLKYLNNFKDKTVNTLITVIIILCLIPNFYFKYSSYLSFYKQNDNIATAVPIKDKYALKHIKSMTSECIFVSDPLTQIQIEALGNKPTAKAQYIKPDSRRKIYEFSNNQTDETYKEVINIDELEKRDMCFVYSSRLHTSVSRQDINWLFHTYSLPRDSSNPIQESTIKSFMLNKGYRVEYQDPNFLVFNK